MSNGDAIAADAFLSDNGAFQDGWLDNLPEGTFEKDDTGQLKQGDLAERIARAHLAEHDATPGHAQ